MAAECPGEGRGGLVLSRGLLLATSITHAQSHVGTHTDTLTRTRSNRHLPSRQTFRGLISSPTSKGCGFTRWARSQQRTTGSQDSCWASAFGPSKYGPATGHSGGAHAPWGAGSRVGVGTKGQKESHPPNTAETRSPLNSKTIILATRNYWGGKKVQKGTATLKRSG